MYILILQMGKVSYLPKEPVPRLRLSYESPQCVARTSNAKVSVSKDVKSGKSLA